MARTVSIGAQGFAGIREGGYFLVDKTGFIREWWRAGDQITLVCRPRRFGKTLTLSMVECFLSLDYAGRGKELFGGLAVWGDPDMRELQGKVPVISLSFAKVKRPTLDETLTELKRVMRVAVRAHDYLNESPALGADDREFLESVSDSMDNVTATSCLGELCRMLYAHHGVKPVVLLDEYDTPMQEAWLNGYWDGMSSFVRSLFNSTFKTNPSLGRALITGITRVASESIFSDLNNPKVVTVTTPAYETAFGFTQAEVDAALEEFGMADMRDDVRDWYDGFTFGDVADVYNPWSITSFLDMGRLEPHWVNTSSNGLVSSLVRRGDEGLKRDFEALLSGGEVIKRVDERVDFRRLRTSPAAVFSLLLATGYLKVTSRSRRPDADADDLSLALTNREVRAGFDGLVRGWFCEEDTSYNGFVRSLLAGEAYDMECYLGDLADGVMSSFDSAARPSRNLPERFWHGLVLGLLVELRGRYEVRSNPESGRGRADVVLAPLDGPGGSDPAVVIEFKVLDPRRGERVLADAVESALGQIRDKRYAASLQERGIAPGRIRCYGIAFEGRRVLIGVG